jgi:hypothetical protein
MYRYLVQLDTQSQRYPAWLTTGAIGVVTQGNNLNNANNSYIHTLIIWH